MRAKPLNEQRESGVICIISEVYGVPQMSVSFCLPECPPPNLCLCSASILFSEVAGEQATAARTVTEVLSLSKKHQRPTLARVWSMSAVL